MVAVIGTICLLTAQIYKLERPDLVQQKNNHSDTSTTHFLIANLTAKFSIDWQCKLEDDITAWQLVESWMTSRQITDSSIIKLGCVLKAMQNGKITHTDAGVKGTQLKLSVTLEGTQMTVFKPKVYNSDFIMVGTPYAGKDRHYAEIAAFHLNRIIELNKVPLVVGRKVDLESEIRTTAHQNLLKTFYYKNGNTCFYGKCHYCRGPKTGVCGNNAILEGSLTLWLPDSYSLSQPLPHPWRRTYRETKPAVWERDQEHCKTVKGTRPYEMPPRLLDLIDISIFDFLISNADRHHIETFEYSRDSIVVALDNGKSFGNPYVDEESILAPLYQCCVLREATYNRLSKLKNGVLGQVLFNVLKNEPLAPILTPQHYVAVDRRLTVIFNKIDYCFTHSGGKQTVLIDDGYT